MNTALWIAAGSLAVIALLGGLTKTFVPRATLSAAPGGAWTAAASDGFVKSLGIVEILAAVGLILPAVLDIAPVMVAVTALCWVLLMIGAMVAHGRLGEYKFMLVNAVYLAVAAFVAWGRFVVEPVTN
ncbi:hypothetical protein BOX37_25075 [Nocardia mangyaensis]|uniref:DoxX family protein n=1 Tax=Nocardia mangyaensis TaxID=2213200 RepID=A0A1J0VXC2_9NOCA|nr:DoxX family protein [Nocardia mangyaensis]APE36653.1 hypothetical protein BOX37_25075 [Nocardia mangyaensis]